MAEQALPDLPPRARVVREGERVIMGDRNNQYGPPTQDFDRTAAILNAMGYMRPGGKPLVGHDIAILVMAVKLSRVVWSPEKEDHWVDIIGYAGCGWECVVSEQKLLTREGVEQGLAYIKEHYGQDQPHEHA